MDLNLLNFVGLVLVLVLGLLAIGIAAVVGYARCKGRR